MAWQKKTAGAAVTDVCWLPGDVMRRVGVILYELLGWETGLGVSSGSYGGLEKTWCLSRVAVTKGDDELVGGS